MPQRCSAWVLAALMTAFGAAVGRAEAQNLATIPLTQPQRGLPMPHVEGEADLLRARFHLRDAPALARFLGHPGGQDGRAGHLDIDLRPGVQMPIAVGAGPDPLAASFIVDHDDPAVQELRRQLLEASGPQPVDAARLVDFVARVIQNQHAIQYHLASEVAKHRQGDCTEHALLLAALARSLGLPARIVHGVVLLRVDGHWQAVGHAWVQMRAPGAPNDGGEWQLRDSALASAAGPRYYLPFALIEQEGPGFRIGLMQAIGRMPSRVKLLQAPAP